MMMQIYNITLRVRDNKQNCRRIVTWHKYTFILIRYNNRRAKRAEKKYKCAYKNTQRAWTHQIQISSTTFHKLGQLCTGRLWTLYNNIHSYLGHNQPQDIVSLWESNFSISYMLDVYNGRIGSRSVPPLGGHPIVITVCQSVSKNFNITLAITVAL